MKSIRTIVICVSLIIAGMFFTVDTAKASGVNAPSGGKECVTQVYNHGHTIVQCGGPNHGNKNEDSASTTTVTPPHHHWKVHHHFHHHHFHFRHHRFHVRHHHFHVHHHYSRHFTFRSCHRSGGSHHSSHHASGSHHHHH